MSTLQAVPFGGAVPSVQRLDGATVTRSFTASASCRSRVITAGGVQLGQGDELGVEGVGPSEQGGGYVIQRQGQLDAARRPHDLILGLHVGAEDLRAPGPDRAGGSP